MVFEFFSPGIPQICRNAGAEFVLYDMEHTGLSLRDAEDAVRALPRSAARADGARAARRISFHRAGARRRRDGRDGADGRHGRGSRAHRRLHALSAAGPPRRRVRLCPRRLRRAATSPARLPRSTQRTLVIPQIETAEGLANVEAIAAVPGVDALWLGHFDLTNFMGIPAQFKHPRLPRGASIASSRPAKRTARPRRSSPPTTTGRATTRPRASA